ncbi:MAG TPA: DUF2007 domain-containing protein [Thermoanaerobaculia bacterium]|nr:DUF2007 domain-containing protein [Thermoanaerobaculia bacterium]
MSEEKRGEGSWAIAKVVENPDEAALIAGYLRNQGIPVEVESLHVEELPVNVGGLGEVRVRVPADRLDEALDLLEHPERISAADLDRAALGPPKSPGKGGEEP